MAQHPFRLGWQTLPKSHSKSGTGITNLCVWWCITTAERTEQLRKKWELHTARQYSQELLSEQSDVLIVAGALPWPSEVSYHLGELWKIRKKLNERCVGECGMKECLTSWARRADKECSQEGKRRGWKGREVVWETRGEAQLQPDRGPSTCGSPHRPACGRQRDLSQLLALLWSPRCCKALGCHPFVSPGLVSSPVFTQRCVCGCTRPALLGGALSGWFYQQDVGTISEKQDKNLGKAEVDIQVIANNVFLARIGNTAGRGAANKVINNALGIVYGPWTSVYGPCGLMA